MTFTQSIAGTTAPEEILASLQLLEISYRDGTGTRHRGHLVVHEDVEEDIRGAFDLMERIDFPVARVVPINGKQVRLRPPWPTTTPRPSINGWSPGLPVCPPIPGVCAIDNQPPLESRHL
jgi:hypothetical protein